MVIAPDSMGIPRVGPALVVASSAWPVSGVRRRRDSPMNALCCSPAILTIRRLGSTRPYPGSRRSEPLAQQGSGTEFASIRPFQPGDRLRRIHWAQSLRTAPCMSPRRGLIMIDTSCCSSNALNDIGESDGIDGRASSLDVSLRAAARSPSTTQHRRPRRLGGDWLRGAYDGCHRRPGIATCVGCWRSWPASSRRPNSPTTGECRAASGKVRWS